MEEVTLGLLERVSSTAIDRHIRFKLMYWLAVRPTYAEFVEVVQRGIAWTCADMERNPELLMDHSEDQLSIRVVSGLRHLGFDAEFEAKTGGHCDITVQYVHDYVWLGEAKILTDNGWLWKGFQQLTTRYSTGTYTGNEGGMLIYCKKPRTADLMNTWATRIQQEIAEATFEPRSDLAVGAFLSTTTSERTGLPFNVVHFPVSLWFDPQDR